jgi:hypothetical protein
MTPSQRHARQWIFMALVIVCTITPVASHAASCRCDSTFLSENIGILYREHRPPSFDEIVRMTAPVLWFSPDEPLLLQGITNIPSAHPCDTPSDSAVVYYQVADVVLRGNAKVTEPLESESRFFDKVSLLTLMFYFYYPRDIGMGSHEHDIESVQFDLQLDRLNDCYDVKLLLVKAAAHGIPWYSNRLKPAPGTRYPITILVEEGKHASCTDRNSDGLYTPGYDINQFVNDGWGVRDVFGAGFLFTGNYNSFMTKPRSPETRLLPPAGRPPRCASDQFSSLNRPERSLGRYLLRPGSRLGMCPGLGTPKDSSFLDVMMKVNGFGTQTPLVQNSSALENKLLKTVEDTPQLVPGVSLRWDESDFGASIIPFGIDLGEGWLVGRVGFLNGTSTELMFTRSASRWSDGYFSGGWEWRKAEHDASGIETSPARNDPVWETGVKVRVSLPEGKIRWLFLNYRFAGIRTGVRFNGVERLENGRFTLEFGAGVW